jgi:MarR family transcriptional regulator, temperature-dependent positive regulator of motility
MLSILTMWILMMARTCSLERQYPWAKIVLSPDTIVPHRVPFTLARRLQQICGTVLSAVTASEDLPAPLAYAVLATVNDFPGIDQRRLALLMGVDRTNAGQIVDQLEAKGLIDRRINGADRRSRELRVTRRGAALRRRMRPKILAAQDKVLAPLTSAERIMLIDLLTRVVEANEMHARPGAGRRPPRKKTKAAVSGGRDEKQPKESGVHGRSHSRQPRRIHSS